MALCGRLTTRRTLLQHISVSICLCALAFLPLPQGIGPTWVESAETECPGQEGGESSQEKQVVDSSARRRCNNRRHSGFSRPHEASDRLHQTASYADRPQAIVGHQLANGLGAPLLI